MVIKNACLQYVILVVLSGFIIYFILAVLGRWIRNNNFTKTKGANYILVLFTLSLVFILKSNAVNAQDVMTLRTLIKGVTEVTSTFIIPVILGIMFTTSEYDQEKDKLSKTKTVTTETVNIDSNGVGHYEKITTVTEQN